MKKLVGFFSLLFAGIIYGSFGIWIRLLSKELMPYQQIFLRNIVGFVLAGLILIIMRKLWFKKQELKNRWLLFYVIIVPVSVVLYNLSVFHTTIAVTIFSLYVGSILVSLLAGVFIFHEPLNKPKIAALVLVICGLLSFIYPFSLASLNIGFLLGFTSGILDGVGNALRKNLAEKYEKFSLVFLLMMAGILLSFSLMLFSNEPLDFAARMSSFGWLIAILFGFILMFVNYLALVGFQNFDLNIGTIIISSELFFALAFGWLVFREVPAANELIGGFLIMVAIVVLGFSGKFEKAVGKIFKHL
jgi:drug/metabolite transporter (DMT)-like permease